MQLLSNHHFERHFLVVLTYRYTRQYHISQRIYSLNRAKNESYFTRHQPTPICKVNNSWFGALTIYSRVQRLCALLSYLSSTLRTRYYFLANSVQQETYRAKLLFDNRAVHLNTILQVWNGL